jgi:riboflavin synthase alpha subunit
MGSNPKEKVFTLNTIIDGHLIRGHVVFSPAPEPGVLTEVARLEAELLLGQLVRSEIADGRL